MRASTRLYRTLPRSLQPLSSVLFHTVHPGRSAERFRWRAGRDAVAEIASFIDDPSPVVVDGGAHLGQSIERFRRHFRDPTVHAFEPVPEHVRALQAAYGDDDAVTVHAAALGDEDGDVPLIVNEKTATSSVLPISRPFRLAEIPDDDAAFRTRETITVRQARLDSAVPAGVDVVKLDCQGYELPAFRGCGALLDKCAAVMVEVAFLEYYDGQALFPDVDRFLRERGFALYNLYDAEHEVDGRLGIADAVYLAGDLLDGP